MFDAEVNRLYGHLYNHNQFLLLTSCKISQCKNAKLYDFKYSNIIVCPNLFAYPCLTQIIFKKLYGFKYFCVIKIIFSKELGFEYSIYY